MAMVLPLSEVLSLINRSTKALHLAAMIDADGQVLTVLEPVLGHQVANPLCRLSQLLADLKGFYDAAHL
jgi:hypothetical protein